VAAAAGPSLIILTPFSGSFLLNYIGRGEFRRVSVMVLMIRPYGRLVVLQIALLVGGVIAAAIGQHWTIVALLMLLKIVFDLFLHVREREMFGTLPKTAGKKLVLSEQFKFFPNYEYVDVDETYVIRRPYVGGQTEVLQPDETWAAVPEAWYAAVPEAWYFDKEAFMPLGNRPAALMIGRARHAASHLAR
jgi:hypothetical protein